MPPPEKACVNTVQGHGLAVAAPLAHCAAHRSLSEEPQRRLHPTRAESPPLRVEDAQDDPGEAFESSLMLSRPGLSGRVPIAFGLAEGRGRAWLSHYLLAASQLHSVLEASAFLQPHNDARRP